MTNTTKFEKLGAGTYKATVTIPWEKIEAAKEKALVDLQKTFESKGFRKGKAPAKVVRETLGDQKLLEESSKYFLSDAYVEIIETNKLKPFIDPKITLVKAPIGTEWEVRFEIAEAPVVSKLADYRKIATAIAGDLKKDDIWVPGKDKKDEAQTEEQVAQRKNQKMQKIFDKVLTESEMEISPLILDYEVTRRLTSIFDEIKKLGLTVEQYMASKKETAESMRENARKEVIDIYKSEFILDEIANKEKVIVDEKDLEPLYKTAKTNEEKETLKQNAYMYTRIMRKQKTLDFIASL